MGTQIELRHLAFFGAMDAVSKEKVGEEPAAEKKDDGNGEAASSYAASPVSPPAEKGSGQKVSLFADCSEIKGTKPLTVPYTVGGKKESVSVCVDPATASAGSRSTWPQAGPASAMSEASAARATRASRRSITTVVAPEEPVVPSGTVGRWSTSAGW